MKQTSFVWRPNETQEPLRFKIVDTDDYPLRSTNDVFLRRLEPGKLLFKIKGAPYYVKNNSKRMCIDLKERIPSSKTVIPSSSVQSLQSSSYVMEEAVPHLGTWQDSCSLCANIGLEILSENCLLHSEKKKISHRNVKSRIKQLKPHRVTPLKIPPEVFKDQLKDTSDITSPIILLPNTKRLLEISIWQFDKSLMMPLHSCSSKHHTLFQRNCFSNEEENEIDTTELNLMPLGYKPKIDMSKIKRITRKRKNPHLYVGDSYLNAKHEETQMKSESIIPIECNDGSAGYVQALFDPDNNENKCFLLESNVKDNEEILVIQDRNETAKSVTYTQKNIDVLLAAAAKNNSNSLVFCEQSSDEHIETSEIVEVPSESIMDAQRIIFLHDANTLNNLH